ncbi:hypothetical protein FOZ61_004233 [Perkinsus olseni]|uniref:ceramidase n=1 Tax=Perkinsus olseni TaxID=32597 RepID=A0A7J6LLJ8_PEROL|nr:hypothetical protein FOZ61_004233 [Perkinsus olseni]KAF4665287.1 hypothetical protein FOL46_003766 [Perkinsus olseni]
MSNSRSPVKTIKTICVVVLLVLVSAGAGRAVLSTPVDPLVAVPPEAPTVTIDLSKVPEERFKPAVKAVLSRHSYNESFEPFINQMNATLFDALKLDDCDYEKLREAARRYYPEQLRELQGISDELAANGHDVSIRYLLALMYAAELEALLYPQASSTRNGAWCTAVMIADTCGTVIHGRNMDLPEAYGPDAGLVTLNLNVINVPHPGVPDYKAAGVTWLAASLITAEVPGRLSMELNARYYPTYRKPPSKQTMFDYILSGRVPVLLSYRQMIERNGVFDFDRAVEFTSNSLPLSCPIYFAVVGAGRFKAAVMARDEDGLAVYANGTRTKPLFLDSQGDEAGANKWYLVQTNYDHWEEDPPDDPRRTIAENCIKDNGRTYDVTSTTDVVMRCIFKDNVTTTETVYTTIMNPTDSQFTTFVRYNMTLSEGTAIAQSASADKIQYLRPSK